MIRFLFRLLAMATLAVAVVLAVLDATRSIAISKFDPTPLGGTWFEYAPDSLESLQATLQANGLELVWDPAMLALLKVPGFIVFAVLAFLLFAIGRRPARRIGRFATDN
ncbi:MAG: hypothetical protein Q8Q62_04350 [Mesorhizobium sp.]|nr:hypothetical protein [Mesorhizobium sp.]